MERNALMKAFREDRDKRNLRTAKWHRGNPARSYVLAAKTRAKKQNVEFDLEPSDVIFPEICPILGIPLIFSEGGRTDNTPSLDRIIPLKGYVKGNVEIISWKANRLKNNATLEELEKIVKFLQDRN